MSTGRSAQKRAAKTQNKLMTEQENLLEKEESRKKQLEKDTEQQRISTLKQRFGGSAMDDGTENNVPTDTTSANKYKIPNGLTKRNSMMDMIMQQNGGQQ